ncbi:MAG TPA: Arc family DNA-binding protein [Gaiellaceae bacterium]|jgi:plasmid stability protein
MATLHLRNVPTKIYERLRRRAKQNGRSMNAEAVALLEDAVEREDRTGSITAELRRLANTINLPPDAPRAEEIIRQDRESH